MEESIELQAKIERIIYKPTLCNNLKIVELNELCSALAPRAMRSFILKMGEQALLSVSKWVGPKRSRTYPYASIYDILCTTYKKVAIIPVIKDEGAGGELDYLQWDTVSLLSLLGVYVVPTYYVDAEKNKKRENKITNQKFDVSYVKKEIEKLLSYQSEPLHWNLEKMNKIYDIAKKALKSYDILSKRLGVELHPKEEVLGRINKLYAEIEKFKELSRKAAQAAQDRETKTMQPKEMLDNNTTKAKITIENLLGGLYHFTCDEVKIEGNKIYLIEAKNSKSRFPSLGDIKDGLVKMALYTNISEFYYNCKNYTPVPILKLTYAKSPKPILIEKLKTEAQINRFQLELVEHKRGG
ncbi:hypothetical protein [Fervidobacterium sp.]